MAAVCVWAGFAHAATAKIASEASGDDFYKRGYYPEALAELVELVTTWDRAQRDGQAC